MPDPAAILATFAAGLLSFASPCTAPLLPAYLSVISGVGAVDLASDEGRRRSRGRLVAASALYVAGFTSVLVVFGFTFAGIAHFILANRRTIEIIGGVFVIGFGLMIMSRGRLPFVNQERRLPIPAAWRGAGIGAAFPIGVVFGVGWTPCAGPYLAVALGLAGISGTALAGGILLACYALGVGLPFIAVALAWASAPDLPQSISRASARLVPFGGLLTIALGAALVSGAYEHVTSFFAQFAVPR